MSDVLREIYNRFDPDAVVTRPDWRADRPRAPSSKIVRLLDPARGSTRVLLVGTVGSGKSTELSRILEAKQASAFVVGVDLFRHFLNVVGDPAALRRVQSWEVIFLATLAVARRAGEELGPKVLDAHLPPLLDAWRAAAMKSQTAGAEDAKIDPAALIADMAVMVTGLAVGATAADAATALTQPIRALKWAIPLGRAKQPLDDQTDEVRTLLAACNQVMRTIRHMHQEVLLIVDGLDRVEDLHAAKSLFGDSALLGQLDCQIVLSGPFVLRHDPHLSTVPNFRIVVLDNEPVLDERAPEQPGSGVDFFLDVYARRTKDVPAVMDEPLIRELAYRSGGRVRDFVKLVREAVSEAELSGRERVGREHVERAVDDYRRLLELGLHTGHIELLRSVKNDPHHRLPSGELALEMIKTWRLLPYPDGSEWFYPHPVLLLGALLD